MPDPISHRMAVLRGHLFRQALVAGACATLAVVLGAALGIGAIDYLVRFEDPGVRILATLGIVLVGIGSIGRFLIPPWRHRPSDIALAQRVEQRNTRWGDQLSSAVAFAQLPEDALGAGSPVLRRAVITAVLSAADTIDWRAIVPRRPLRRSLVYLGFLTVVLAGIFLSQPRIARTAVWRLIDPLGNHPWPRMHYLVVKQVPNRIAAGSSLEIEAVDRHGRLPRAATIHYRIFQDGAWEEESAAMQRSQDGFVARRGNVTRPIEFRVTGGDDTTMPWHPVDVVEPPGIRALTILLHPPAYTGYLAYPSERHIRTLEGTEITLEGEATERIRAARLVLVDEDQRRSVIEATLVEDASQFVIDRGAWKAASTARYWFELEDFNGLIGKADEPMSLRVFSDAPPAVSFELPAQDIYVTPDAKVPCTILVKDDLAIREVVLLWMRDGGSGTENDPVPYERIPLFEGPDQVARKPEHADLTRDPGDRRSIEYVLDLAPLKLSVGSELKLGAEASDYHSQVSRTVVPRKLSIISHAELEIRLGDQQSSILADLEQAWSLQRTAHAERQSVAIQMDRVEQIRTADRDALHAIERTQQQIARLLTDPKGGILGRIADLMDAMRHNQIDNPNTLGQMIEIRDAIERLGRANLPIIARELTTAIKAAEMTESHERADSVAATTTVPVLLGEITSALATVGREQQQVLEVLERLVADLREKAGYRQFARDFAEILADQERCIERTRQHLATTNPSARTEDLTRQQQADLQKTVGQQNALARRAAALGPPMVRAIEQLAEQASDAGGPLADGLAWIRDRQIPGSMREAAQNMAMNRMGRALEHQMQVADDLRELINILRNREPDDLNRRIHKLREAERDLEKLRDRTIGLRRKLESSTEGPQADRSHGGPPPDANRGRGPMQGEHRALEQDMDRMERRLKRLAAQRASRRVDQAAARLRAGMAQDGTEDDRPAPTEYLDEAARDLQQAQEELAAIRRQAEQDLAEEQLVQLETVVHSLVEQQSYVLTETQRLQAARDAAGRLTPEQIDLVRDLADEEALLYDESTRTAQGIGGLGAIRHALLSAARAMHAGAQRLARQETDQVTQRLEREALMQLQRLLVVLVADRQTRNGDSGNRAGEGGRAGGGQDGNRRGYELAELQLLRILQQDLRDRTRTIEQNLSPGARPTPEERLAMQGIGEEQDGLAQVMSDLRDRMNPKTPAEVPGEGPGDDLPDLDRALEKDLERSSDLNWFESGALKTSQSMAAPGLFSWVGSGRRTRRFQATGMAYPPDFSEETSQSDEGRVRGMGVHLAEGSADDSTTARVIRIHEQMEEAVRILREGDTTVNASPIQEDILRDLDQWIESLKRDPPPPSANGKDPPPPTDSGQSQDSDDAVTEKPGAPSKQAARDSDSSTSTSSEPAVDMTRMHHLMDGIWGHLPSRMREQLIQSRPDTFLPEYELEIEQYYRRLAEDSELDR